MNPTDVTAPEWRVSQWFNAPAPLSLAALRGRVVMTVAFQMLCPGCVAQALPQAQRVREIFSDKNVSVVGLHSVFEHHNAMTPTSLKAFLHEYHIDFPVGVDEPSSEGAIPQTMAAYQMRGTPTVLLYDRMGRLRRHNFGHIADMQLGAELMALVESQELPRSSASAGGLCASGECS